MNLLAYTGNFTRLVKIQHSIFAFPFLVGGVFLASGWRSVSWYQWLAMVVAMVAARNAAMAFNRVVDADWDAKNPRTAVREIPRGVVSKREALIFITLNILLFIAAAAIINRLALMFALPVIVLLLSYSYTKRFTWICHFYLGMVIGMAPVAGWVAVNNQLDSLPFLLMGALMFYIAGFDILYATQDAEFDRIHGLRSVPAQFGVPVAIWIARLSHFISFLFFVALGLVFSLSCVYWIGIAFIAVLMILEHFLVTPDDLSKIQIAFFHLNSVISIVVGGAILGGVFVNC